MPTLTVELPEAEYQAAIALSESERNRIAANAFATARNEEDPDEPFTEEDIVAIKESFAQAEAGQIIDGDVLLVDLREKYGWIKK